MYCTVYVHVHCIACRASTHSFSDFSTNSAKFQYTHSCRTHLIKLTWAQMGGDPLRKYERNENLWLRTILFLLGQKNHENDKIVCKSASPSAQVGRKEKKHVKDMYQCWRLGQLFPGLCGKNGRLPIGNRRVVSQAAVNTDKMGAKSALVTCRRAKAMMSSKVFCWPKKW